MSLRQGRTLNVQRALGVNAAQLVGRLALVRSSVAELRRFERQRHHLFVNRHDVLCVGLELFAVLKPTHLTTTFSFTQRLK